MPTLRLPSHQRIHILRALEIGAKIVVVPMVNTAAIAQEVVRWGKFPPLGERGFNTRSRGLNYGLDGIDRIVETFARANAGTHLIAQIETLEAAENLDAILAVPGLSGILVGPGDLSTDMGKPGQFTDPTLIDTVSDLIRRARAANKHAGIMTFPSPLLGLSRVGVKVVELLRPFGCHILAYDPYWNAERAIALGVELLPDLDSVIARADVLSLHTPVTDETRNLLDARRIGLIQPGAVFINTARGVLVDQDALFARAYAGDIEAYLDVTVPEPLPPDHPAWQCPHIFITPHVAGPTEQTLRRMAEIAVSEIERYLRGEPLQHEVTPERYDLLA